MCSLPIHAIPRDAETFISEKVSNFVRTASTRGRKPTTPDTPENISRRCRRRKTYERHKFLKLQMVNHLYLAPATKEMAVAPPEACSPATQEMPAPPPEIDSPPVAVDSPLPTRFRLSARRLFLTYPRVDNSVSVKQWLSGLKSNPRLSPGEFLVSKECHSAENSNCSSHFHCVAVLERKVHIRNAEVLDITIDDVCYHGQYVAASRDLSRLVEYVKKDKEYESTNLALFNKFVQNREKQNERALLAARGNFSELDALEYLEEDPIAAVGHPKTATKLLQASDDVKTLQQKQARVPSSCHTFSDFHISSTLQSWIDTPDAQKPPLVLIGKSGSGKTRFVDMLAKEKEWKMITINVKDGMRNILPKHDLIFFDDYSFKESAEELLSLFTREPNKSKQHKIIYQVIEISGHQILIFAMNESAAFKLFSHFSELRFIRRLLLEYVPDNFLHNREPIVINQYTQLNFYNYSEEEKKRVEHNECTLKQIKGNCGHAIPYQRAQSDFTL